MLIICCVLSLHHFLQSSISHNFGVASKVTTSANVQHIFFADRLLHLQAVFGVDKKIHCGCRVSLHNLVVARDDLHQWIDELHRKDHQYRYCDRIFYDLPTYDLWYLGCILCRLIFDSPLCNVYNQQINILMSVFIYHYFHFFAIFMLLLLAFLALMLITLNFLEII